MKRMNHKFIMDSSTDSYKSNSTLGGENSLNKDNDIYVGRRFSSYEELAEFLTKYETSNKQKFYKKRSRTIETASKNLQRVLKKSLKYYELEFECIHGKERAKRGNGLRQTSTLRLGCKAHFKVRACTAGEYLTVYSANVNHTRHELSKNVFEHLRQNRTLNKKEIGEVETYLSLDANKKKIQNKILLETGKKTILKDLHNINSKIKIRKNDLEKAVNILKTKYHCNVHVFCDEAKNFKALQFTTENMKNAMRAWPEFVSVDGTYKLIDMGCTVFLCLVEDSNGQAEIVCVSILAVEDRDTYHWVFDTFKNEMDYERLVCFMGDKDLVERDVIKEVFPDKLVYLCIFHTLKTFRREINCDKLGISKKQRELSLEYLQKLIYSKNESEYDTLYSQFKECVPQSVTKYFEKNWHSNRSEWLVCNMTNSNFKNTTNNRMESINHKIKQVVPKNSTLIDFIKNFFIFLDSHNQERDTKAANHILKKSMQQFKNYEEDMILYLNFLTNYSFNYVQQQIEATEKVKNINEVNSGIFEVSKSNGKIIVTIDSCECSDFSSMMLPCRHILAVRIRTKVPLFSKDLCHVRWTKEYYLSKKRIGQIKSNIVANPTCAVSKKQKIMTLTEKRKAATLVTNSLVSLLSLTSNSEFNYKLELLKKLEHCWKIGKMVSLEIGSAEVIGEADSSTISIENDDYVPDRTTTLVSRDAMTDARSSLNNDEMSTANNVNQILYLDSEKDNVHLIFDGNVNEEIILQSNTESNVYYIDDDNILINNENFICETDSSNNNNTVIMNTNTPDEILTNSNDEPKNIIKSIVLPPKIKKRGRPKGHEVTVIGLKKKRNKKLPIKFILKTKTQQVFYIMSIISKENSLEKLLLTNASIEDQTFQININDIKDQLPDAILDPSVVLEDIKKYFTPDAWGSFLIKLDDKKKSSEWFCRMCSESLGNEPSIICESCLFWYHLKCSALITVPKIRTWFCTYCYID